MRFYLDHMKEAAARIQKEPKSKLLMDQSASTFAFYVAAGSKAHRAYAQGMKTCHQACLDRHYKEKARWGRFEMKDRATCFNRVGTQPDLTRACGLEHGPQIPMEDCMAANCFNSSLAADMKVRVRLWHAWPSSGGSWPCKPKPASVEGR